VFKGKVSGPPGMTVDCPYCSLVTLLSYVVINTQVKQLLGPFIMYIAGINSSTQ